ncbi:MAG: ankyrin repeat domain-containing protein [Treponema sp.]|uniref:ankyrin repeat domain-containing protein n=1 Tax=Treponema sp. TaxID=166 RepID=UPI001D1B89C2|nr:ankyrin repeat domain-containing protein [Treponema sp.]MBS7310297.1 ankyrin repeat domain-containing protein [Treponema sp.]
MNTFKRFTISLLALFLMSSAFSYSKKDLYNAVRALNESHVSKILKVSPELSKLKFDADGNSILMIAIQYGCNDKIIDHILRAGCSPDLKNKNGQTAIMFACNYGTSKKTLKRLIEFNVFTSKGKINRILLKDKHGKNAFDYCADNKNLYDFLSTYTLDPATIKTEPISTMPEPEPPLEEQPEEDSVQEPEEEPEILEDTEILEEAAELEPAVSEAEISQDEVSVEEIPEPVKEEDEPEVELEPEPFLEPETEPVIEPVPAPVPEPKEVVPGQEEVVSEAEEVIPEQEEVVSEPEETEPEPEPEAVPDQEEIEETISVEPEPEPEALPEEIQEEPETIEETSSEAEITTPIEVPQIDYYNSKRPEYLFDEIETEYLLEDEDDDEVLDDIRETKVRVIENPDALDNVGRTRLMNAIMENDDRVCYILLESGANPNAQDKDGWTPLMYACRYAQTSTVIQLLFEYGAKLDAKSNYQVSVLQIAAAYSKNRKVLATVLEQAVNLKLNLQDSFIVALKEARSEEFIGEYLKYNLNLNSMYKGKTPLMYAAEYYESTDVIKLLLEKGADPYIISSEKKNAFSYAKENSKLIHDSVYWSLNVSSSKKR